MSKKGVELTVPFEFNIFISPGCSTIKSLSSPACLISTGLSNDVPKLSRVTF